MGHFYAVSILRDDSAEASIARLPFELALLHVGYCNKCSLAFVPELDVLSILGWSKLVKVLVVRVELSHLA